MTSLIRSLLPLLAFSTLFSSSTFAQTQADPVLVGTTPAGGEGIGTIFQFTPSTSGTITPAVLTLTVVAGAAPQSNQLTPYNGKLYGMTTEGGTTNEGVIFVYDPVADTYTKVHDFSGANGIRPFGSLTLYNNKLYGMTNTGGIAYGVIFVFDPATNTYTKLKDFTGTDGSQPRGALTVFNNKLYGVTSSGGLNSEGVLFEFDPATNIFTKKKDLTTADGGNPFGSLTAYGTKLYGLTWQDGALGAGVLFEYDPITNTYTKRKEFDVNSPGRADGASPIASLAVYNNKLYGTTGVGGVSNNGTLFEYDPATTTFTKKLDANSSGLFGLKDLVVLGNELYGVSENSKIYSYNPATNTITIRKTLSFSNQIAEGYTTQGGLVVLNNRLYGLTSEGGAEDEGVLYEFNPTGNVYSKKRNLSGSDGRNPLSGMVYYNGKLYGTTRTGGVNGAGTIYEYDPITRVYTKKKDLSATDGSLPWGSLLVHNCKLYGLTSEGGTGNGGVLFEYDPLTNTYTKKWNFAGAFDINGGRPYGSLAVFNNKLYGLTYYGGVNSSAGVLFEYDLTTNTYTKKRDMSSVDGRGFYGRLTLFNNKFYGLMGGGGGTSGSGLGTLFEYDPITNVFTKKQDFSTSNANGHSPTGSLVLFNNKLYGLNSSGGGSGGVLFEHEPVANTIVSRYTFGGVTLPTGSLVVFRGKLYGQTMFGGSTNEGVVFSYDPALSGPAAYSTVFSLSASTTGYYRAPASPNYQFSPQLVVFPDCQLSATATVASSSICVNDVVGVLVAVSGQNCQPSYSWTGDAFTRLSSPANTSAISATALQAGIRSFSVTVTESLCSVSTTTASPAFDIFSVKDGTWDDPTMWSCGRVPFAADIVNIRHLVTLPPNYIANALRLRFDSEKRLIYGLHARLRLAINP